MSIDKWEDKWLVAEDLDGNFSPRCLPAQKLDGDEYVVNVRGKSCRNAQYETIPASKVYNSEIEAMARIKELKKKPAEETKSKPKPIPILPVRRPARVR